MQTHHPSRATSAAEYVLIVGSGVGAAASLAVQQLAIASLPVALLVAMGLLNRYRLDSRVEQHTEDGSSEVRLPESSALSPQPATTASDMGSHAPISGRAPREGFASNLANAGLEVLQEAQKKALQGIGQILHQARAEQQLSLEGVHMQTYIQLHQLRAMEAGDLSDLPQPFYVQRLIHKYAQHLGLDAKAIAARFPI
jgi:hypothetical protein